MKKIFIFYLVLFLIQTRTIAQNNNFPTKCNIEFNKDYYNYTNKIKRKLYKRLRIDNKFIDSNEYTIVIIPEINYKKEVSNNKFINNYFYKDTFITIISNYSHQPYYLTKYHLKDTNLFLCLLDTKSQFICQYFVLKKDTIVYIGDIIYFLENWTLFPYIDIDKKTFIKKNLNKKNDFIIENKNYSLFIVNHLGNLTFSLKDSCLLIYDSFNDSILNYQYKYVSKQPFFRINYCDVHVKSKSKLGWLLSISISKLKLFFYRSDNG